MTSADTAPSTQSTVSKAAKQLEDELGVQLLERVGRGSKLTAAGEVVYRHAPRMRLENGDRVASRRLSVAAAQAWLHLVRAAAPPPS